MEFIRLFHFALRWLTVLVEAGALLWLASLALALLGWALWGAQHLYRRGVQAVAQPRSRISRLPPAPEGPSHRARGPQPRSTARR
jgi:hypothetical protein